MTIVECLTQVNSSYIVALAVAVCLMIEAIKASNVFSAIYLPLVASLVGTVMGIIIGLLYQESLLMTGFNGFVAGLLASGSFDWLRAVWHLPKEVK
ncbi:hypothetical protein [uncultured Vagococcus sp.]|uniref:hypothetical protein n=1 Tax=uncultured Vagococcus sp. TaxID=189676 RepID=UPI0028D7C83D|nr:hypothetical protein [uncultured Vagococcus sp.]